MSTPAASAAAIAAVLATLAGSCTERPPAARSVVLITLDTTRADALGAYGAPAGLTPNIDQLASESVCYLVARTVAPLTLPAHASMFTGLYPPRHGVRGNGPSALPADAATLAEAAQRAGHETAAFVACLALDRAYGVAQGFDTWSQPELAGQRRLGQISDRPGAEVVADAAAWLAARDGTRPYFLWVHLFDPHAPYEAPAEFRRPGRSPYHAEVAAMDAAVGALIGALALHDSAAAPFVAIVADHGEGLGEHGEDSHGLFVWETTVRVPLLLRYPDGGRAGARSEEIVSVVDVAPTLLAAMDLALPPGLDGRSLYRDSVPRDRGVYFESYEGWRRFGWSPLVGWANAEAKFVRGAREGLFAVEPTDPGAAEELPSSGAATKSYLDAIARMSTRPALAGGERAAAGAELLAGLAQLGYDASYEHEAPYPEPLEQVSRPDPRDRLVELGVFQRGRALVEAGDYTAAVPLLEALLSSNPHNVSALDWLAAALLGAREHARAAQVLQRRLQLGPERIATHRDLSVCYKALGDAARYREHGVRALELTVAAHERRGAQEQADYYRALLDDLRASE